MSATVRPSPARPQPSRPAPRPSASRPSGTSRREGTNAPRPDSLATLLVSVWLEIRAGLRPLRQLEPLVTPVVYRRLGQQMPHVRDLAPAGRVRGVRVCCPAPDVCEAAVTIEGDGRTTAVALRLERHLGRWRAVEMTAPEAGLTALTTRLASPGRRPRDAFDEVLGDATGVGRVSSPRARGTS